MDGIVLDIRDPAVIRRVNSRGKMSGNGSRYFYSRHLPADDQDFTPAWSAFAQQAFEVPIVAAVDNGNVGADKVVFKVGRYDGLSKEAGRNDQIIIALCLRTRGRLEGDAPRSQVTFQSLSVDNTGVQHQLEALVPLKMTFQVAMKILADIVRSGELIDSLVIPAQVAKSHSMLAAVGEHEGMDLALGVVYRRWPQAADILLGVKQGNFEEALWCPMQQVFSRCKAGRPST